MTNRQQAIDLLIEARWIAPVETDGLLNKHAVAIDKGRIVAILPSGEAHTRFSARETVALPEHLLIPGLINLHTHAAMSLMRGLADDLPLMEWLQQRIWPTEGAHLSHQFVLDGTRLACAEMLKSGVTCFNDMYFYPDAAATAAAEYGMRAVIGVTTLEFPTPFGSDADDYLAKGLAVREARLNDPLTHFCLAPHAPYTVSDATFARILTLSEQMNMPIHCHIHETQQEIAESMKAHGLRPLARLRKLGLLGPEFIGVHAVHLDDADLAIVAETGCNIAHCPSSNLKLGSGIAPVAKMRQLGINVGLGTDGCASNNRLDILAEMRLAALLAKGSTGDASALPAAEVLHMATLGAATALGIANETGSIAPGKSADLCAIHLGSIESQPCYDPLSHLIYVTGREAVSDVWVAGKCCVKHKKLCVAQSNSLEATVALWQNTLEFRHKT